MTSKVDNIAIAKEGPKHVAAASTSSAPVAIGVVVVGLFFLLGAYGFTVLDNAGQDAKMQFSLLFGVLGGVVCLTGIGWFIKEKRTRKK